MMMTIMSRFHELYSALRQRFDNFRCNWIIDRNLQVGLLIMDSYGRLPLVEHDKFWEDELPEPLYTIESIRPPNFNDLGSTIDL